MILAFTHPTRPDIDRLEALIAAHRERAGDLEAAIEEAGEQSAIRRLPPALRANRSRWPRSAWRTFLREVARQAMALQPELCRLRTSLGQLERQVERAVSTDRASDNCVPRICRPLQDIKKLHYAPAVPQSPAPLCSLRRQ